MLNPDFFDPATGADRCGTAFPEDGGSGDRDGSSTSRVQFFMGRMLFLLPNQQSQSTEGETTVV